MIPSELIRLRDTLYAAHGRYIKAWSAYTALQLGSPRETIEHCSDRCCLTGADLELALDALIAYLEAGQPGVARDAELRRHRRLQTLLQQEVALVQRGRKRANDA